MRAHLRVLGMIAGMTLSGCKAAPPSKAEARLIWGWKHHVSIGGRKERNPLHATPQSIAEGKQAFSYYCEACHGLDAQNTGVPFAGRLSPPAPSLASKNVQQYTDGQLKWVIDNGIRPSGMPASRGTLSEQDIWSIVIYLRHLPKAGSLGDPPMYSQ